MERINDRLVSWASLLDDQTRQQAITSAEIDFIYPHIALMPDAHLGYGATVGSVIPILGAVMPAAVGVDIGCGMTAVQTQFKYTDLPSNLTKLREEIERSIPVSAGRYNRKILPRDRKSTRLNSSHVAISYAVFCLKKKIVSH